MAKQNIDDAVSLFPFLSILACVIGILILMITAVALGQIGKDKAPVEDAADVEAVAKAEAAAGGGRGDAGHALVSGSRLVRQGAFGSNVSSRLPRRTPPLARGDRAVTCFPDCVPTAAKQKSFQPVPKLRLGNEDKNAIVGSSAGGMRSK
jgi:hypothetical protein